MPKLDVKWQNLDAAFAALEQECSEVVMGMIAETWNSILVKTPQFTGGLVASWTFTQNPTEFVDRSENIYKRGVPGNTTQYDIFYRGHPQAIAQANMENIGKDLNFKLGQKWYFTNGADHGEGPYSAIVESWTGYPLRLFNRPGQAVKRSIDRFEARYGQGVSSSAAARLKTKRLGSASSDT